LTEQQKRTKKVAKTKQKKSREQKEEIKKRVDI